LYSLYLNDLLIAENLDDFEYELENLNYEETYNVKVIAINEFGENESLLNFTTLEAQDLLLSKFQYQSNSAINFEYDELYNLISKKGYLPNGTFFQGTFYNYNQNNLITNEGSGVSLSPVFSNAQYTYQNSNLNSILLREGNEEFWEIEFSFSSNQTYIKTVSYIANGTTTVQGQFEIHGNFNNEGATDIIRVFKFKYFAS
jgi:hypothetical protein